MYDWGLDYDDQAELHGYETGMKEAQTTEYPPAAYKQFTGPKKLNPSREPWDSGLAIEYVDDMVD